MNAELKPCEKCGGRLALYTRNVGALILCRGCDADWQYDNVIDAVADNLLRPSKTPCAPSATWRWQRLNATRRCLI